MYINITYLHTMVQCSSTQKPLYIHQLMHRDNLGMDSSLGMINGVVVSLSQMRSLKN